VLASVGVDAADALADLTEVSSQVEAAVVTDASGAVLASTLADAAAAGRFGRAVRELLVAAGGTSVAQLEAATASGSVFVATDGPRIVGATTGPSPVSGLVFHDLQRCLQALAAEPPAGDPAGEEAGRAVG
jgi:hypothetical protein